MALQDRHSPAAAIYYTFFSQSNAVAIMSVCVCVIVCVCVCVLHASVFPKDSARTAAVSPYKDVCCWKEGWRKKGERAGREGSRKRSKELIDRRTGGRGRGIRAWKERMRGSDLIEIKRKRRSGRRQGGMEKGRGGRFQG